MRNLLSGSLIAAAFGTAVMVASALPASAQVVRAQSAFNTGGNDGLLTLARNERSGGNMRADRGGRSDGGAMIRNGGPSMSARAQSDMRISGGNRVDRQRWSSNNNWSNNNWRYRHRHRGYGGVTIGLGLGAPYYYDAPYYAYEPYDEGYYVQGGGDDAVAYCMSRFRSYDPASGTYLGYDGLRHPCP